MMTADLPARRWRSLLGPRPNPLARVFASLVGSQAGAGILGLIFWTIAARALRPSEVGVGAALVAAMTMLSTFGVLGVGTFLLERFKVAPTEERRPLFGTGLFVAMAGGALVTAAWLGLSQLLHLPGALGELGLRTQLLLGIATAVCSACIGFDQAVIGMGASNAQLRRNILASVIRIATFCGALLCGIRTGDSILVCWMAGMIGSLLLTPVRRHLAPRHQIPTRYRWRLIRTHWTTAVGHHVLTLAMGSSSLMLPVVVASLVPAADNAYFAPARLLSETSLGLLYFLTIALFATADGMEGFRRSASRTLVSGLILSLCLLGGAALFGRVLLLAFGTSYAQTSLCLLLILLAAGPALLVKEHFVVMRRLQGRLRQGCITMGLWTGAELIGAIVGGLMGGVTTLCLGWLAVIVTCALSLLPALISAIRTGPSGDAGEAMQVEVRLES